MPWKRFIAFYTFCWLIDINEELSLTNSNEIRGPGITGNTVAHQRARRKIIIKINLSGWEWNKLLSTQVSRSSLPRMNISCVYTLFVKSVCHVRNSCRLECTCEVKSHDSQCHGTLVHKKAFENGNKLVNLTCACILVSAFRRHHGSKSDPKWDGYKSYGAVPLTSWTHFKWKKSVWLTCHWLHSQVESQWLMAVWRVSQTRR